MGQNSFDGKWCLCRKTENIILKMSLYQVLGISTNGEIDTEGERVNYEKDVYDDESH